jgi:hypothetical protein
MSGDATLADTGALTLATVNDDAGTYGDANTVGVFTIDAKGRITNASSTDIDHDALLNFASNEHIDHTTVSVSAGDGLSGGGDISSSRTLSVLANNGIVANSTGVFVDAGDGIVVNSTGVHVSTTLSGSFQFDDLTVSGNLVVNGTTTELNITTLVVEDSLIKLASNNTGDSIDFGFYGQYEDTGTKYAGLYRDASDGTGVFKLFDSLATEPTGTTVGGGTLAALDVGALDASSLVLGSALAVSYGGTGQTSLTDNAVVVGNGTSAVELVTGSAYQVLQVNGSGAVVFGSLDAGTF